MKIERKSRGVDEGDIFYIEPRGDHSLSGSPRTGKIRRLIPLVITAIFAAAITLGVVKYTTPQHFGLQFVLKATTGKIALTQGQLRDIVVGEGLTVYWLGPEDGALYALVSINRNQNYIRYLPGGVGLNDVGANFRVVGTYASKNAFAVTQNQAKTAIGVGFTNSEGNAVYYNTSRPLSVYVGLKSSAEQIELFNPIAGQALADARAAGILKKIK